MNAITYAFNGAISGKSCYNKASKYLSQKTIFSRSLSQYETSVMCILSMIEIPSSIVGFVIYELKLEAGPQYPRDFIM